MGRAGTRALAALSVFLLLAVSGCADRSGQWSITLNGDAGSVINASLYESLGNCSIMVNGKEGIPLEIFLYHYGLYPVTSVSWERRQYDWHAVAYSAEYDLPVLVLEDGRIFDGKVGRHVTDVNVTLAERPTNSTLEIAPAILNAMDGRGYDGMIGPYAPRVVVFYVDGLGYERYLQAKALGVIDNITALGEPIKAVCQYPSISRVNARSLVTGQPPDLRAGDFRNANPGGVTILDTLDDQGRIALWICGRTSPVNLHGLMVSTTGYDGDGYEADEVADEAIRRYADGAALLLVHFKDPDTSVHRSGPYSGEAMASLGVVDEQLGRVVDALEPGTVVVVYADHGGHETLAGGNHGTLLPEDMIVPVLVHIV